MSEAELYVLLARLNGGIRNKAARGELRRGLPVGFVWGEADGEVRFHPDEAVVAAIREVFARFAEMGSARRVWLWFRSKGLKFPLRMHARAEIRWASYTAIHHVLSNPVYAGAYVYGKRDGRRFSTPPAGGRNAFDVCPARNGGSSSPSISPDSSSGRLMKPISAALPRTRAPSRTRAPEP
jgi:hypothetical protein